MARRPFRAYLLGALNLTQTPTVDVVSDYDDELPTWNAASAAWHARCITTRDACPASWDAASRSRPGLKLANAPGSAGAKVAEMGADAEEEVW